MEVHLTFLGKGAHVGLPFLGDNALENAIPALASLLEYKRSLASRLTDEPLLFFPDKRMGSTMNITMIKSGLKANIIPDTCSVVIDRRFTQEESFEGIREEMESLVAGFENVRIEAHHFYDPVQVAWDTPWHQKKIEALSKIYGLSPTMFRKGGMGGASDMSYIQKVCPDVPIVGMGVMSPRSKGAHAADEAVHFDDLAGLAKEILYMLLV
jgi:acetylornithine deacetylase/succinyl-diaminopimelate desuccinylase-like protein